MSKRPLRITCFGECLIEHVASTPSTVLKFAGDSFNTAYYLKHHFAECELYYVTSVGVDAQSSQFIALLKANHIKTEAVLKHPSKTMGEYTIYNDPKGERSFSYKRDLSAAREFFSHKGSESVLELVANSEVFYFTGISIAMLTEQGRAALHSFVMKIHQLGVTIIYDNNYRPALWRTADEARDILSAFYPYINVALVTLDDEQALFGDQEAEACLQRLTTFIPRVIVKQGGASCVWQHHGTQGALAPTAVPHVVDTTGAGDAFNAACIAQLLQGAPMNECVAAGHRLAGKVIQQRGAILTVA